MKPKEMEFQALQRIVAEYREQGYVVILQPAGQDLPPFLTGFTPDAVLHGHDEHIVLEVKASADLRKATDIVALAKRVEEQPGWRLELAVHSTLDEQSPICERAEIKHDVLGPHQIRTRLKNARLLLKSGHVEAALLVGWTALEATLRRSGGAVTSDVRHQARPYLLKALVTQGAITRTDYHLFEKSLGARNRVAHGQQISGLTVAGVSTIIRRIEHLLEDEPNQRRIGNRPMTLVRVVEQHDVRHVEARRLFDPSRLTDLFLVQASDSPTTLCAIGVHSQLAVFFEPGNMSFHSTGGGAQVASGFAAWVKQHNIRRSLRAATRAEIDTFIGAQEIDLALLKPCADDHAIAEFGRLF